MIFCIHCGKAVSIFDNSEVEVCRNCLSKENSHPPSGNNNKTDLNSANFSTENGKLVLKSKEGWLLWSGSADKAHSFQVIRENAMRILKIRHKRKK